MKKILMTIVLFVALGFALESCGNSDNSDGLSNDSTAVDSISLVNDSIPQSTADTIVLK